MYGNAIYQKLVFLSVILLFLFLFSHFTPANRKIILNDSIFLVGFIYTYIRVHLCERIDAEL